jgi:hypothetical protein
MQLRLPKLRSARDSDECVRVRAAGEACRRAQQAASSASLASTCERASLRYAALRRARAAQLGRSAKASGKGRPRAGLARGEQREGTLASVVGGSQLKHARAALLVPG